MADFLSKRKGLMDFSAKWKSSGHRPYLFSVLLRGYYIKSHFYCNIVTR